MLRACAYCGKIHKSTDICDKKPVYQRGDREDRFRWTQAWKDKREEIKRRDLYLCRACLKNIPGTEYKINTENLSVHHIQPLHTNYDLRLDNDNLITLCDIHHELAERGVIPAKTLKKLIPP